MPFLGLPRFDQWPDASTKGKKGLVVVGVPFDLATKTIPGSRFAPSFVRAYGREFDWIYKDGKVYGLLNTANHQFDVSVDYIFDHGDINDPVSFAINNREDSHHLIQEFSSRLSEKACISVFLGGDHSITVPILRGSLKQPTSILIFDAHGDYNPNFRDPENTKLLHNNINNFLQLNSFVESIVIVGHRNRDFAGIDSNKLIIIDSTLSENETIAKVKAALKTESVYVSVDIDCLDPSILPSTGAPVPLGLQLPFLIKIIDGISNDFKVIGADIVEFLIDRKTTRAEALAVEEVLIAILRWASKCVT